MDKLTTLWSVWVLVLLLYLSFSLKEEELAVTYLSSALSCVWLFTPDDVHHDDHNNRHYTHSTQRLNQTVRDVIHGQM